MKTAAELYPEYVQQEQEYGHFYGPGNYQPIIDSFGKVLLQVDDNDYQGDSRILYRIGNRYGYLIFGWGSCSGCDALQGCDTIAHVDELIQRLHNSIVMFDTLEGLQQHFENKDWALDYSWHSEETKRFVDQVKNYRL